VSLLENLYGPYEEPLNSTVNMDFTSKWLTNLDISYSVTPRVTLSVGANNLFNQYPDRQPASKIALLTTDVSLTHAPGYTAAAYGVPLYGAFQYGQASPFGYQGGFYYARIGVKF
jgi:iron complex outermembrane receptor protein